MLSGQIHNFDAAEQDWTVDVTLNLSGKMTYQF
jgi:hypothetical protein